MRPQTWGPLSGMDTAWEIYHNKVFQKFIMKLLYWTGSPRFTEMVFRGDVYRKMRAVGFTGLYEAEADNYLRHTNEETVGYIHFKKCKFFDFLVCGLLRLLRQRWRSLFGTFGVHAQQMNCETFAQGG